MVRQSLWHVACCRATSVFISLSYAITYITQIHLSIAYPCAGPCQHHVLQRAETGNRLCILHFRERHHEVSLSGRNASNEGYTFWEFSNATIASRTTRISRSQPSIRPVFSVSYTTSPVMRLPDTAHTDAARR